MEKYVIYQIMKWLCIIKLTFTFAGFCKKGKNIRINKIFWLGTTIVSKYGFNYYIRFKEIAPYKSFCE